MATPILIIWPASEQAGRLCEAVLRSGLGLRPKLIDQYPDRRTLAALLAEPDPPKAVVVGMALPETALQLLRTVKADAPGLMTAAADARESADLMRSVMRTGAADFLLPPFPRAEIERAFGPIAAKPDERPEGLLLAVMPCRGNDGASTVALHLAHALSKGPSRPALLVDCDIQCGVSAFRLGLKPSYSLADALAHADHLDEFLEKIAVRWRSFDLIAAPDSGLGLMGDQLGRLPQVLAQARRSYGAVIADMPPSLYAAGLEAMRGAQTLYLVCTPDLTSLHLARRRVNELLESGFEKNQLRVILNRFDSRRAVAPADIERVIGAPLFYQLANDFDGVHRAAVEGGLVMPESELGRDLEALAERVTGGADVADKHGSSWKKLLGLR